MTLTTDPRAVVSWEGPGAPIMLTLYGPDGEVTVPQLPKRVTSYVSSTFLSRSNASLNSSFN